MLRLRAATPDDEGFVNGLTRSTMRPYVEATWTDDASRELYYRINAFDLETTRIVCEDQRAIGRLTVHRRNGDVSLDDMHVVPEMQNRGVGSWLLGTVIGEAGSLGLDVVLILLKTNPVKRLYERVGFEVYGEANGRYLMRYRSRGADD